MMLRAAWQAARSIIRSERLHRPEIRSRRAMMLYQRMFDVRAVEHLAVAHAHSAGRFDPATRSAREELREALARKDRA
jgi:hypothetical protein